MGAIAVSVVRTGSSLVPCSIRYYIEPNGDAKFYGGTNILYFDISDTVKTFTVIAKNDGVPQVSLESLVDNGFVLNLKLQVVLRSSNMEWSMFEQLLMFSINFSVISS